MALHIPTCTLCEKKKKDNYVPITNTTTKGTKSVSATINMFTE